MATGLDDIDHRLLALLQHDDRVPVAELGKTLGVPPSTLNDRIRRLLGDSMVTAIEKLMGLVLTAIAVEMVLAGLKRYFFG